MKLLGFVQLISLCASVMSLVLLLTALVRVLVFSAS